MGTKFCVLIYINCVLIMSGVCAKQFFTRQTGHASFWCRTPCTKGGSGTHTCISTQGIGEFCSPFENADSQGIQCSTPCAYHTQNYLECLNIQGDYGYCSHFEYDTLQSVDLYGDLCTTPCKVGSDKIYYCATAKSVSSECSPGDGSSIKDDDCVGSCSDLAWHLPWCYILSESHDQTWEYCSLTQNHYSKSKSVSGIMEKNGTEMVYQEIRTIASTMERMTTIFSWDVASTVNYFNVNTNGYKWVWEMALQCIRLWVDKGYPTEPSSGSKILEVGTATKGVRLDRQNGISGHHNLQLQVNGVTGKKSTIACIIVPIANFAGTHARTAFLTSLHHAYNVRIRREPRNLFYLTSDFDMEN